MTFLIYLFCSYVSVVFAVNYFGPQARIVSEDGHLILYAAEHKNISFVTRGRGGVHVNGVDVSKAAKISNDAIDTVKKYQMNFEKIDRLEQLLDDGRLQKAMTLQEMANASANIPINSASLIRSVRKINRRVNNLQRSIRVITSLLSKDECLSDPCKNGGTCKDLYNDFICHCPSEWEGPLCDQDVNECNRFVGTDLGCQNGATCVNRKGSYECLCPHGWFGLHCTSRRTDCKSGSNAELCGHGTCVTQYNDVGYKCICDQGWTTDGRSPACNTDVDECAHNIPHCSVNPPVQCINLPGSFHCGSCPSGYSGNGFYCVDIDECITSNGGCSTNPMVQCINTLGSRICGSCPPGYYGDGVRCSYQGVCSVNNGGCHPSATCRNNPSISTTYVQCLCPDGYIGNGIGPNGCVRSLQPTQGPCFPNPCRHGTCTPNGTNDYTCTCYRKFTGKNCDMFRNLCAPNPCENGATCRSYIGMSYTCICPSQYTGLRCEIEKQACGGRLSTEEGVLVFPSVKFETYDHSMSCAWTIETNSSKILNITFSHFNIEHSYNCRYDWLQIHDGKNTLAPSLGRFCGQDLPNGGTIITTHNIVYLWFRSDHSVSSTGFNLTWTSIVPYCGENIGVTSHGFIQSPGSPGNYPNNRDCFWILQTSPGKRFLFHFFTLMLGNDSKCDHDFLEFRSGTEETDPVIAKFCNTTHPAPLFSPGSDVLVHFHSDATNNYPGFQITYSVAEGMPGCGGVYTTYRGEIRSPSYNGQYPNDIQCEYKIQLPETSRIKITFLSFELEESEDCQFDAVSIYSGNNVDAPLIGRYCGSEIPSPYETETNVVLIVFKTDWSTNDGGFVVKYETVCGGRYTNPTGVITSPGYPNEYGHSLECIYEIGQPLGKIIELQALDFDVESNSYPDCVYDFLEIRDGHDANSTLIGTYCGHPPPLTVSSYNYLWLKFQTDTSNNGRGFKLNYTTTDLGCGGIMKERSGTFSTPRYPDMYPPGTRCKWIISVPAGNVIQIVWMNFQLEKSFECTYDYVEIFENNTDNGEATSIGKFCGQTNPPTMLSTSNLVTIVFQTDNTYHAAGFLATYNSLREVDVCGGNYYSSAGILKSPRYPDSYPPNIECAWMIQVKPGHQIMLNVTDFSLEKFSTCRYDWLEIRNGGSGVSPLLGKYCGTSIPKIIPSHANKLFIRFKSDMTKVDRGFKITWEATATGCGGTLTSPTGSIISPNYPEPYATNTECTWKISTSMGSKIQVVFSDLDLEEHSECMLDYVEILDGSNLNSKSLGRFCLSHPPYITSTSNSLTVKFRSDLSRNGRGFQLQYRTMCNNTVSGFRGVIESPNFPNSYPSSVDCNWEILVADRNKINISFSHFDLEKIIPTTMGNSSESKCVYDYVEVEFKKPVMDDYEEEGPFQKYGIYCGDQIPPLITLNAHHARIHFASDNLLHGNGFRLEWQIEGCGDILTHPNGTITSPNYPKAYPPLIECNWKIQVDYGNHIEITFDKVELEKTNTCYLDFIKIFNGEDDTYQEIASICHQNKPITLRSSGNFMFIKFKADVSVEGLGFMANYTSKPTKCGGKYVADSANIMSPNFPKNYDQNDTCGYEIEVTEGHRISLTFKSFDLYEPSNHDCSVNNISFVKVYDGPSNNYPVLAKICGRSAPNDTLNSTTNQMYVEMVTQTNDVAKGFLATYKKSCGARIETEGTGIIRMNAHDLDYDEYNCSWTIVAKDPSKHVSLTITHLDTLNGYCDDDTKSLKIYNGDSPHAPVLGTYCGSKIPPTLTSDGSALHIDIEYNSVIFATYSVFDSHCGGTLSSTEGFFASPGYPKKYPMETECEWTIDITEGNHVSLSFTYFELFESEHCNTDYLEIRQNNGTGKLLGTFCGNDVPTNITGLGSLWIFLKTSRVAPENTDFTAKGFYAEYILNHFNELSTPSGRIVSPLYNQDYPLWGEYSWKISVNFGKLILLTFKEINTESTENMCFSTLNVYDGSNAESPLLKEVCGNNIPDPMKSSSNVMFIHFSGYSTTRSFTRFIMEWMETDVKITTNTNKNKPKGCGTSEPIAMNNLKNYTKVASPGYPDGYAPDLLCEWVFTTTPMNRLRLIFVDMDLQPTYGSICYADYVEIFEKRFNSDWTSILKTCHENITSRHFIYTSNIMKIVFKTDRYANRTGFMAFVREACGGTLTDPFGYIYYDNNTSVRYAVAHITECQWNITVRAGRTIELEFLEFDIQLDKDKGCTDYLLIRNGQFPDSPILGQGKYCGAEIPSNLTTTGNNAYIKFHGHSRLANFKIRYREVSYQCGGEIILSKFGGDVDISSPKYPNSPPPHVECTWRIIAPPGEVIRIDFQDRFDISSRNSCGDEYLEVRDGGTPYSKLLGKFCGDKPNSKFSTDNMMFVKFFTQLNDPSNGFKAKITLANCGGTIYGRTGQIQSPFFNDPKQYPVGANCTWHIKAPPNHNMILKFNKIDLEDSSNCTGGDHVKIYEEDLVDKGVTSLGIFCGNTIPDQVKTSGDEVIIHFETSRTKQEFGGFALQFNASVDVCGGTIEASEGTITSPGYPNPHKEFRRCSWSIKVPRGRRVTLKVEDYDMDSRLGKSWLAGISIYNFEVYKGFIKQITADDKTAESTDNTMFIIYWSRATSGRGFKAKFTSNQPSVCEGDLNEESGIITQPKVSYTYYCTHIRNKPPIPPTTLSMTITTTTNITVPGKKVHCFNYLLVIKIETEQGKDPLAFIECVPARTVFRSPHPMLKVKAIEYTARSPVNYTISYRTYQCGGIINREMGTIRSPGYPNRYSQSIECSWLLQLPEEQSILLTFEDMNLGDNCEKSYLDIYNGNSPKSPKIDRYCQSNKPDLIRSQTNSLWIDYKFDQDSNGKGFSVKYEPHVQGCGGVFHDRTRIIQSPSFPDDYPNNAECLWELRSDEGYHIGLIFTTRFQIEQSDNCENDYLEIWDWKNNGWYSLGKKCGREFPKSINSTSNRMRIMFRSNERIGGQGFRAQWEWNCGGTFIADNTERFIVSPGFPEPYKKNLHCQYNISSNNSQFINIKFYQFDLEGSGSNCRFDNLTVSNIWHQGNIHRFSPLYRQVFCGHRGPPNIRLTGTIFMLFQTDNWVQRSGYKFSYQLDNCGGNINVPTVVNSPNMNIARTPGLYNGYMNCVWNISAPAKKNIVIQFQKFSFSFRRSCYFDNVEIYEGQQITRAKRIANLCGDLNKNLPVIKIENNSAIMSLKTDRTQNHDGFQVEIYFADGIEAGCGGKIQLDTTTTITAPNLVDMDCSWTVQSPVGTNIKIHFDELNLPSSCDSQNATHSNCNCAALEVKDGHPAVAELIEKFCGLTSTSFTRELTSTGNLLGLRLRTRGSNKKAFKVTLRSTASICGPVYLNVSNDIQTLESPSYPNNYPSDLRCAWVIKGAGKFMIHFVDFDLNEENGQHLSTNACNEDRLQIVDEADTQVLADGLGPSFVLSGNRKSTPEFSRYSLISGTHQFCGKADKPFDYYSSLFSLVIKFSSGSVNRNRGRGFKLEYHLSGCNRNFTSLQGRIVNTFNKECFQTITVPENYTISVFFQQFVIYQSNNCEKVGIEIRDGKDGNAKLLQKTCGYALPNPVFSSGNKLWIRSWNLMGNRWPSSFDLVYTSSDKGRGCGGTVYNYQGSFTSPMHPMSYKESTPCQWEVRVPIGMRVAIKFQVFDIQGDCEHNYVKVTTFNAEDSNDHKYCTNDNPATLYSNSRLLLTYQSSTSNSGTGWHVLFEAVSQ